MFTPIAHLLFYVIPTLTELRVPSVPVREQIGMTGLEVLGPGFTAFKVTPEMVGSHTENDLLVNTFFSLIHELYSENRFLIRDADDSCRTNRESHSWC